MLKNRTEFPCLSGVRVGVQVYPHRLRHTAATKLLNASYRITSIQKFLGHKKLNTTMIYARLHDTSPMITMRR
jgi:site-specific recombinase XerC